jgi:NADH:ubiquinone oxidoreductase subunit 6 (subunit J)
MATYFVLTNQPDSALHYGLPMSETSRRARSLLFNYASMHLNAAAYAQSGEKEMADIYFKKALAISDSIKGSSSKLRFSINYIPFLLSNNRFAEAKIQAYQLFNFGKLINNNNLKLAGAGYLRQVFDTLQNKDSAYFYSRMEATINSQIFSQNNINKIQALAFNEQIRNIEETARIKEAKQLRNQNIQYALIALGIIILLTLYLLLSRSFITNTKLIEFFGVVALLIVFEFLNLLLHPFLERVTQHSPVLMLLALVCIAALLVPLHHKVEKWATAKLVEKNKKIRLAAAKKTIEQLGKDNYQKES